MEYSFEASPSDKERLTRRLLPFFSSVSGTILDIGCGRGSFLKLLVAEGHDVLGVEFSDEGVQTCKSAGLPVVEDDALGFLRTSRQVFGGAVLLHVVEHLSPDQVTTLLSLLFESLSPGSPVVIATPNVRDLLVMNEIFWLDSTHVRPYPAELISRLAEGVGYHVVKTGTQGSGATAMGRRRTPQYLWRRLMWGRQYGRTEAYIVLGKP